MAKRIRFSRDWLAKRVPLKIYRENWQKRLQAVRVSLWLVSKRLPWKWALTRKGVLYLSALLMAAVTVAGIFYLTYGFKLPVAPWVETGLTGLAGPADEVPAGPGLAIEERQDLPPPKAAGEEAAEISEDPPAPEARAPSPDEEITAPQVPEETTAEEPAPIPAMEPVVEDAHPPGVLVWPVEAGISSPFGWRLHPVFEDWRYHPGVDLAAPLGTAVQAALDGVVADVRKEPVLGLVIVLSHGGGWETRYGHCGEATVEVGQYVSQGEVIAAVGDTGLLVESHLHFELRCNGQALDPAEYLQSS